MDKRIIKKDKKLFRSANKYMSKYGFNKAFNDFDDWKEITDEEFHVLKRDYIHAAQRLERYVKVKSGEWTPEDCYFTLNFCVLDDCQPLYGPIHKEIPLKEKNNESLMKHIREMIREYWKTINPEKLDKDGFVDDGVFFDVDWRDNEEAYLETIIKHLLGANYYCCNGVEKYYGAAFAIDYTRFSLSLKDVSPTLFDWNI